MNIIAIRVFLDQVQGCKAEANLIFRYCSSSSLVLLQTRITINLLLQLLQSAHQIVPDEATMAVFRALHVRDFLIMSHCFPAVQSDRLNQAAESGKYGSFFSVGAPVISLEAQRACQRSKA